MASKKVDPAKLTPETLALLLSNAGQQKVTESQVLEIAEAGRLLSVDNTINLIQFTAFLAKESSNNND
jgi:hypothetical protein